MLANFDENSKNMESLINFENIVVKMDANRITSFLHNNLFSNSGWSDFLAIPRGAAYGLANIL